MTSGQTTVTTGDRRGISGVYLLLLLQTLIASGTHVVAKVITGVMDAGALTLVRSTIAACAMGALLWLRHGWPHIRKEEYPLMLLLGFLTVPVNQYLFLYGMRFTIPSNASLLYATTPIFVLLYSRLLLKEPLTHRRLIGVALGFTGVVIVIMERGIDVSRDYLVGNLLIFLAVQAWALFTVFGRRIIVRYGAIEATSATLILGTILFFPLGLFSAVTFSYDTLTAGNWLEILYLGLVTSVFSYLLWYHALERVEAGRVALFTNLQPILTTALMVSLLGQDITAAFLVGGAVAICGVVIAQLG